MSDGVEQWMGVNLDELARNALSEEPALEVRPEAMKALIGPQVTFIMSPLHVH